jgi:hypothetical protein
LSRTARSGSRVRFDIVFGAELSGHRGVAPLVSKVHGSRRGLITFQ